MSLFFPASDSDIVTTGPRLHAFVIGVDAYDHLVIGRAQTQQPVKWAGAADDRGFCGAKHRPLA